MQKARNNHARRSHLNYDLYGDLAKIKEAIADASSDLKGKAGQYVFDTLGDFKDKTTTAKDSLTDYAAERPLKSLGIAMMTGIVIGYFLHK